MDAIAPALMLFAVAGGYAFIATYYWTRHRAQVLPWERTLFEAGLLGCVFFLAARLGVLVVRAEFPVVIEIWRLVQGKLQFPFLGTLIVSIGFALFIAGLANRFSSHEAHVRRVVRDYGGELLILIHDAAENARPLSITMSNRKVYVGFITKTPTLKSPYIRLLPTLSGHRNSESLRMSFETEYWPVYDDLRKRREKGEKVIDEEQFAIVLPIAQIASANIFDDGVYTQYFVEQNQEEPA